MAYTETMLAANTPIKYSLKLVELLYNETIYTKVTNTSYEGEIKSEGDRVRVRTLGKITMKAYTKGMTLATEDLAPTYEDLLIDKQYYFKFVVDDIDKLQNDVATINEYAQTSKRDMAAVLDTDILTYMAQNAHEDNVIGTAYATGTVSLATTGVVTGSGTTFTVGMIGGYLKATGHTTSYIVTAFSSSTVITVADQGTVGDATPSYSGGALSDKAYSIAAATPVQVTKATIYSQVVALRTKLGNQNTPKEGRFLVVNSEFEGVLLQAPEFIPAVGAAYEDAVKGAKIGRIAGFDVYSSEAVVGSNTALTGFWFIAGTRDYCAMALQIMKTAMISSDQDPTSFVTTCKGLLVWGKKVFAGNRGRGAVLRAYF